MDKSAFEDTPWLDKQLTKTPLLIVNGIVLASNAKTCIGEIAIPEVVKEIEEEAFGKCSSLTNIVIPEGVIKIGDRTFYKCTGLATVVLPESLEDIGDHVFDRCTNLKTLIAPDSVVERIKHERFPEDEQKENDFALD